MQYTEPIAIHKLKKKSTLMAYYVIKKNILIAFAIKTVTLNLTVSEIAIEFK